MPRNWAAPGSVASGSAALFGDGDWLMILVIDDEELVRSSVCEFLQTLGYEVIAATDGLHALDLVRDHSLAAKLRVVISDVDMPGLTGPQAWQQMKPLLPPTCRVLFISGRVRSLDLGPDPDGELLVKPFPLATLQQKVAELIGDAPS